MGFIAKDNGGNFKRVPSGTHMARCYKLIDLGTQRTEGNFGTKDQHKIQLGWELFGEDDDGKPLVVEHEGKVMPMTITKSYTVSLHEKSALRKDLASWRGRDFTEEEAEAFDVSKLLGAYCMLSVTTSENAGKTYSNISGISRIPAILKDSKPAPIHGNIVFDLDAPDMTVFGKFHEKLQEAIKRSPEWRARFAQQSGAAPNHYTQDDGSFEQMSDDIPF